jgi:hypothetical protein
VIDDILAGIFGEVLLGNRAASRRAQLLARLFFGLLGAALGVAGALHVLRQPDLTPNAALRASMVSLFVGLACFFLFNVALARKWRWPGLLFVVSFASLFVTRLAFGA